MISVSLEGDAAAKVNAAAGRFVDDSQAEARAWMKNMGYAISGATESLNRQKTAGRLHMYPSVRAIGDDVRLQIRFKKANAGARKIARRSLAAASSHIWNKWRVGRR